MAQGQSTKAELVRHLNLGAKNSLTTLKRQLIHGLLQLGCVWIFTVLQFGEVVFSFHI